jgi:hypothetical protein
VARKTRHVHFTQQEETTMTNQKYGGITGSIQEKAKTDMKAHAIRLVLDMIMPDGKPLRDCIDKKYVNALEPRGRQSKLRGPGIPYFDNEETVQ